MLVSADGFKTPHLKTPMFRSVNVEKIMKKFCGGKKDITKRNTLTGG